MGAFKGTLLDRGVVIHLEKAPPGLPQTRRKALECEAKPWRERLKVHALQYRVRLEELYEQEPHTGYWPALTGREAEIWDRF
jgi:hypothetical protein